MFEIVSALWPVFALILLGYAARRGGFPGTHFWQQAEKSTYFVLFPVLLVSTLSSADMSTIDLQQVGLAVCLLVVLGSAFAFVLKPFIAVDNPVFTSFYQGAVRFNTFVGLAGCAALYGDQGVAVAAVVMALMIPLVNLCCVLVFAILLGRSSGVFAVVMALVKNPLIIGSLLGLGLNQSGIGLPGFVSPVLELLSRMALPLGLLAVGAGLSFSVLVRSGKTLLLSSMLKLILLPVTAWGIAILIGLDHLSAAVLIIFASLPTATSAYILARQMGGDAPLMSVIITGQTVISMVTIPLVLVLLI